MDSKKIIKRLENEAGKNLRTKGSHHQFRHPYKEGLVTVPHPEKDLKLGTYKSISKQAGWDN